MQIKLTYFSVISFCLFALFICVSCAERQQREVKSVQSGAEIMFRDSIHDFGTFDIGGPIRKYVFTFRNTGKVPAVIVDAVPSCRCITVSHTKELVRPGGEGEVTVTFDGTQAPPGYFDKSVRVRTNAFCTYTLKVMGVMKETIQ